METSVIAQGTSNSMGSEPQSGKMSSVDEENFYDYENKSANDPFASSAQEAKKPSRVQLNADELKTINKEKLLDLWKEQQLYCDFLENQIENDLCPKENVHLLEDKLKRQLFDSTRRENILIMKLTKKEQEMQNYLNQIEELKTALVPNNAQLQTMLLDPAINFMYEEMKQEVDKAKAKVEEMQSELSAWKFTPDSNTGKRLMAKCRLLYQENEDLGKVISSGRIAKLEGDLALHKSFSEEMKKSQAELDDFLFELDEDVEGMQSTVYYLQQQLKESKEKFQQLKEENERLRVIEKNYEQQMNLKKEPINETDNHQSIAVDSPIKDLDDIKSQSVDNESENENIGLNKSPLKMDLQTNSFSEEQSIMSIDNKSSTEPQNIDMNLQKEAAKENFENSQEILDEKLHKKNEEEDLNQEIIKEKLNEEQSRDIVSETDTKSGQIINEESLIGIKRTLSQVSDISSVCGIDSIIRKHRRLESKSEEPVNNDALNEST